jgi:hypothetical protein
MTKTLFSRQTFLTRAAGVLALAAGVIGSSSCGDLNTAGKSPTFLIVMSMQGNAGSSGTSGTPLLSDVSPVINDTGTASIAAELKNPFIVGASAVNSVTLTRYRVIYRRADGRNTPGVDVPHSFDGALSVTIPVGATQAVVFDLVRHQQKEEPPLRNLRLQGGLGIIITIAEVTFYGRDQAGNEVSITGSLDVHFGDFAD